MADVVKRIKTILDNEVNGLEKIKEQEKTLGGLNVQSKKATQNSNQLTNTERKNTQGKRDNSRASRDQLIGNLGVMFAGMALQRAMSNLNSTAKEWVGTGEIMSTTLGVVMLPATIELMEKGILPLSEALLNLDEETLKKIGGVALALEGLGGSFMFLGQVGLARMSLPLFIKDFGKLAIAIGGVSGAITILGVAVVALAFNQYIKGLQEYSKAWNDLGTSVESTTDILGQTGQMTRTIDKSLSAEDQAIANAITPESLGITPTGFTGESGFGGLSPVTDFGPALPGAEAPRNLNFFREGIRGIFGGGENQAQTSNQSIVQNNNFSGFGMDEIDAQINKSNQQLTDSLRIRV